MSNVKTVLSEHNGVWIVDVWRNGRHELRQEFRTYEAAWSFERAQLEAAQEVGT